VSDTKLQNAIDKRIFEEKGSFNFSRPTTAITALSLIAKKKGELIVFLDNNNNDPHYFYLLLMLFLCLCVMVYL
jgi:hypothetical protein